MICKYQTHNGHPCEKRAGHLGQHTNSWCSCGRRPKAKNQHLCSLCRKIRWKTRYAKTGHKQKLRYYRKYRDRLKKQSLEYYYTHKKQIHQYNISPKVRFRRRSLKLAAWGFSSSQIQEIQAIKRCQYPHCLIQKSWNRNLCIDHVHTTKQNPHPNTYRGVICQGHNLRLRDLDQHPEWANKDDQKYMNRRPFLT